MPAKPTVFISYRRSSSRDLARYIHDRLVSLGVDVFFDVETLNSGRFANIIEKEIINRDYLLVILKPDTLESEWVRREVSTALRHHKQIIPVMADGFDFSQPLPSEIATLSEYSGIRFDYQYADAVFERIKKALGIETGNTIDKQHQLRSEKKETSLGTKLLLAVAGAIVTGVFAVIVALINRPASTLSPTAAPTLSPTVAITDTHTPTPIPPTDTPTLTPTTPVQTDTATVAPTATYTATHMPTPILPTDTPTLTPTPVTATIAPTCTPTPIQQAVAPSVLTIQAWATETQIAQAARVTYTPVPPSILAVRATLTQVAINLFGCSVEG